MSPTKMRVKPTIAAATLALAFSLIAISCGENSNAVDIQNKKTADVNSPIPNPKSHPPKRAQISLPEIEKLITEIDAPNQTQAGLALQSFPTDPGHFVDDPKIATDKVVPFLIRIMNDKSRPTFQGLAAAKLMGMQELAAGAVPDLINGLLDESLRPFIAHGLPRMGDLGLTAIPKLIELLDSNDPQAQTNACQSLGKFGDRAASAVPKLQICLGDDSVVVQVAAIMALGDIGEKSDGVLKALRTKLDAPSPSIQRQAQLAIKKLQEQSQ